jgi:hypothetical protein
MKITKSQLKKLIKEEFNFALREQGGREAELQALASEMGGSLEFTNDQGDGQGKQMVIYFDLEPESYPPGTDTSEFQYAPNERGNPEAGGILYTGYFV